MKTIYTVLSVSSFCVVGPSLRTWPSDVLTVCGFNPLPPGALCQAVCVIFNAFLRLVSRLSVDPVIHNIHELPRLV